MRCENCGELLKDPKILAKLPSDKTDTKETTSWTCDNCGQICNKITTA